MSELQIGAEPYVESNKTNAFDFVTQSQESWRNLKRGIISRPQEIPSLSNVLDRTIKKVFSEYIVATRPPTLVAWSVLKDEPLEPMGRQFKRRRPEEITEPDEDNYYIGIHQLNEWGTDFAVRYWLSHSPKHSVLQKIGEIYVDISINSGHKIAYKQAYELMEQVQTSAKQRGQNFEDAVFKALFQHDFSDINMVVSQEKIADCQTINQLALHLGKSLPKNNTTQILRSLDTLDTQKKDSELKRLSKRIILSMLIGGGQSQPGIVEIVAAQPTTTGGIAASFAAPDILTGIAAGTLVGAITSTPYGYVLLHETVHDYQTDREFIGFIPLTLTSIGKRSVNP